MIKAPATTAQLQQPSVSVKPTDFMLSHSLDALFPEVEQLRKLQDAERRLDVFATRKWADLQESAQGKVKKSGILRMFVYNICENQQWQKEEARKDGGDVNEDAPATWTLRVEGRLVDDNEAIGSEKRKQLSDYLSGIAIDLDSNAKFEAFDEAQNSTIVEWHAQQSGGTSFDGLDIKRKGSDKVKCKITIQPKEYPTKLKLDPRLAELVGSPELSERDVIYAMWQYVQVNKLQDSVNKQMINCNAELESLFKAKQIGFPDLIGLIRTLLKPVEPIVIDYEIATDRSTTLGEVVLDVQIQYDSPVLDESTAHEYSEFEKSLYKSELAIKGLDTKIALDIQNLNSSLAKYEFYKKFTENPVDFLERWQKSHAKSLKILVGDEGYTEEHARRSEFYTDEFLDENIDLLLNSNKI